MPRCVNVSALPNLADTLGFIQFREITFEPETWPFPLHFTED